jgi:L,D-transpeptidase ErfK/SrfK
MRRLNRSIKPGFASSSYGGAVKSFLLPLLAVVIGLAALYTYFVIRRQPSTAAAAVIDPAIAALDEKSLQKLISQTEKRLRQLEEKQERLFPAGPVILVDSAANQISLVRNSKIEIQDKCSTGTGLELSDESGKRTWTFDTPRGYFKVIGKVTNPVWYRPDWAFIEEGTPIPKNREERAVANVLGEYAISFGNGFFIHGTLYTRLLGSSATHGCIRLGDDTLKKIYDIVQNGTPIWIY